MLPFTETIDGQLAAMCQNAKNINEENLQKILADNALTQFGKAHGFSSLQGIKMYRNAVPITTYEDYAKDIEKMLSGGKNLLTAYPVAGFCRTSGTTGNSKYIPLTYTALGKYSDYFERYKNELYKSLGGKRLLINSFRTGLDGENADVSLFSEIYFRYLYDSGYMDMSQFAGGRDMIFVSGEEDMLYAKLWEALACEEITMLESQFLYELVNFFGCLEENWREILGDMRKGVIPPKVRLSQKRRELLSVQGVSRRRLDDVQRECEKGFENIAQRLWKDLRLVSGVSNRAYQTETAALDRYLGKRIHRYYLCYCASECYIGTPAATDSYGYVLLPQNAFFEFLPQSYEGEILLPHELKIGEMYEPVITNFSGLYRYRLGDVVKIVGFIGESPVMEFQFRKSQALNIAGEKYDMRQLEKAVFSLRERGVYIKNYCFGACFDTLPGKYLAAATITGGSGITEDKLSEFLDEKLCNYNKDYADLRNLKELGAPRILILDNTKYTKLLQESGLDSSHGHNKPKHIFKGEVSEKAWAGILKKCEKCE